MNCKEFNDELPDLILNAGARPSAAASAHLVDCAPCTEEYRSMSATFAVLDAWTVPEVSPYFDQKLAVRLREEVAAPKMGWFETMMTRAQLNTSRQFRPMMVGALALVLAVGGGGIAGLTRVLQPKPVEASTTVKELQSLDKNEQAFEQLDLLQEESNTNPGEDAAPAATMPPQS